MTDKDFPTAATVAAAVPALAGATMTTDKLAGMPILTSCSDAATLKAKSARVTAYSTESSAVVVSGIVAESPNS